MTPLVSAIMPTRGRPELSRGCLECWQAQTWPNTELIILDDFSDRSFSEILSCPGVSRFLVKDRQIGRLRNEACRLAAGRFIVHFDSDDFYSPERITDQVTRLQESGKSVTSYRNILHTDGLTWWRNENWPGGFGMSLCYRKDWWRSHPFAEHGTEDWPFVEEAMRLNQYIGADAGSMLYSRNHSGNSQARVVGEGWKVLA